MTKIDDVKTALDQSQADLDEQAKLITAKTAADNALLAATDSATQAAADVTASHQKIHDDQVKLVAMIADLLGP